MALIKVSSGMTLAQIEKVVIMRVYKDHDRNKTHTARSLGIAIRTLQRKLHAWGEK